MSRVFLWFFFVTTSLFAELPPGWWTHYLSFVLKKDQIQNVKIIERTGGIHRLSFRWTLYINGGLVMHMAYDKRRYQPLLYLSYQRNAFKFDLFPKPRDAIYRPIETPYALLVFKAFDEKKKEAWFDLLVQSYSNSEIYPE